MTDRIVGWWPFARSCIFSPPPTPRRIARFPSSTPRGDFWYLSRAIVPGPCRIVIKGLNDCKYIYIYYYTTIVRPHDRSDLTRNRFSVIIILYASAIQHYYNDPLFTWYNMVARQPNQEVYIIIFRKLSNVFTTTVRPCVVRLNGLYHTTRCNMYTKSYVSIIPWQMRCGSIKILLK